MKTVKNGNIQGLESLIKSGADINYQDENGTSPLMEACLNDNASMVRFLLKQSNIDTNTTNSDGKS